MTYLRTGKKLSGVVLVTFLIGVSLSGRVFAHCEIPCGIYGDRLRFEQLREHFQTVEKSMNQIDALQEEDEINYNQLVRWINNKEEHANKIQEIVYQYFMNQRIKPVDDNGDEREDYLRQLEYLHRLLVRSMQAKQTTDLEHVEESRELLDAFENIYFDDEEDDDEEDDDEEDDDDEEKEEHSHSHEEHEGHSHSH